MLSLPPAAYDDRTPFAVITAFVSHARREISTSATRAEIVELLADLVPSQNYLYAVRIRGRFAGFRTPLYERGIGVPGGHVHFVDESLRTGGHVLDFVLDHGTLEVCIGTDLHLALPMTAEFASAQLDPEDLDTQIEHTERHH